MTTKPPRIVIDGRMVSERLSGVGRTVISLAKGLAELPRLSYEPVFLSSPGMRARFAGFETIETRTPFLDAKEILTVPIVLFRTGAKLYHSPSHSSLVSAPCPWMQTLHDLIDLRSGGSRERIYYEMLVRPFALKAKKLVTVSETSRQSLQQWLGPKVHLETVYNAIDPFFLKALPKEFLKPGDADSELLDRHGLKPGKYVLALSNAKPHKNVGILVRAFHRLRETCRDPASSSWKLVVTLSNFADEPGVVSVGSVNDGDAKTLLRHSAALAFPSLDEGFGLPPLEAAVMGVPVLISDIPAHREVFQILRSSSDSRDGFQWIDPQSIEGWSRGMEKAFRGEIRGVPSAQGERLAENYSVRRQGQHMDRIYRDVLTSLL